MKARLRIDDDDAGDAVEPFPADHEAGHDEGRQKGEDARHGQVHPARRRPVMENRERLVILGALQPDGQDTAFVVPGGEIARDGVSGPVIKRRRLRARDDDHLGVFLFHFADGVQVRRCAPAVDGAPLLALLDHVAKRRQAVLHGHAVVVVDHDDGESALFGHPDQGLHVVGPVAEIGTNVDQAEYRPGVRPGIGRLGGPCRKDRREDDHADQRGCSFS